jgi:hypothetical protein
MTFEKILPQLIKLTADVGKVIMSFYKADMAVEMKLNKTPLTIADQRAHQLIRVWSVFISIPKRIFNTFASRDERLASKSPVVSFRLSLVCIVMARDHH